MLRLAAVAASLAVAAAQPPASTWYGIAPDDNVPGLINLFTITPQGAVGNGIASYQTRDGEYPKPGTLRCTWPNATASSVCFFVTGVGGEQIQDSIVAIDTKTRAVKFVHDVPNGIYIDNLNYDWESGLLTSVAFNAQTRAAAIAVWSAASGNLTSLTDVSRDVRGGFVFGGATTYCGPQHKLYVGVSSPPPGFFNDFFLEYTVTAKGATLTGGGPLFFPVPSGLHAFCNATDAIVAATTIQADTADRESLLVGNINAAGRGGLFVPFARGDLPTFSQRGDVPLFIGMGSEHAGTFVATLYPPFNAFQPGVPQIPYGAVWTYNAITNQQTLSPVAYYLAGASGVPNA